MLRRAVFAFKNYRVLNSLSVCCLNRWNQTNEPVDSTKLRMTGPEERSVNDHRTKAIV
jgi:hypothetical protein